MAAQSQLTIIFLMIKKIKVCGFGSLILLVFLSWEIQLYQVNFAIIESVSRHIITVQTWFFLLRDRPAVCLKFQINNTFKWLKADKLFLEVSEAWWWFWFFFARKLFSRGFFLLWKICLTVVLFLKYHFCLFWHLISLTYNWSQKSTVTASLKTSWS